MQKTLLFLAANPKKTSPLDLKKEVEEVEKELQRLKRHEQFLFKQQWATTLEALRHALLDHKPDMIHFSGHGAGQAGILLEDEAGEIQLVDGETLAHFFEMFAPQCVILNACFSALQASHIVKYVDFVIGMNQPIKDKAAIQFAIGFYDALAAGKSIPTAFQLGRTNIQAKMPDAEEHLKPVLKQRFVNTHWLMPIPENRLFTGRKAILHQLQDNLHFRQVAALSGFGGVGKTQTAAHYARLHRHEYQASFWCLADTVESLNLGLVAIARLLDLPEKNATEQKIIIAVKDWLATHSHWLLILDNADEVKIVGELTALAKGEAQHILLTTRAQMTEPYASAVAIHQMSRNEGIFFLLRRALDKPRDEIGVIQDYKLSDKISAGKLIDKLGALPLALDQAGAYIRETQCGLAGYLERYQTHGYELLRERGTLLNDHDHPESVAITWLLSFEKITAANPTAIEVLRLCAFLHPDSIPEEVFQDLDVLELDKALKVILHYSFVQRNPKTKILTIHRLVQIILRYEMDEATQRDWAEKAVRAVNSVFPEAIEVSEWSSCERLLPCAKTCAELIEEWKLEFEEAGLLLNQIGFYLYRSKADYESAKPLDERSLAILEKVHGKEHPLVATSLNNLAGLHYSQGNSDQAKPLYECSLAIWEKVHGEEHPSVATSLNNLAELHSSQSNYEKAKPLYERALAIREKVFGEEHPLVATSLNNLAGLHSSQSNYEKAKPLYERALAIREKVFGEEHPSVATSLNNLAALHYSQGNYEKAKPLYERAIKIANKFFKPDHPNVRTFSENYARLLENMKKQKTTKSPKPKGWLRKWLGF
jgi:tetratricopeptide (TPR) repeat protein